MEMKPHPRNGSGDDAPLDAMALSERGLTGSQKAAVIVQMILSEGGSVPLAGLSRDSQVRLACDFSSMGPVDRATLARIVDEFESSLSDSSLTFPETIEDTLNALEGQLTPDLHAELRLRFGLIEKSDPWAKITALEPQPLADIVSGESAKIGAIILSKLKADLAASVVELLPADVANSITCSISQTETIGPAMVNQIGQTLADRFGTPELPKAFDALPVARAAAILNAAPSAQRDAILTALDEMEEEFAVQVRKAIFTFADIPARITPTDIPKVVRAVAPEDMTLALAAAQSDLPEAVAHFFDNMSKRMAEQMREEIAELGAVKAKIGEQAMGKVTSAIRDLVDQGEITLPSDDEDEEEDA
jgi:flagellar motor switch protein FliG